MLHIVVIALLLGVVGWFWWAGWSYPLKRREEGSYLEASRVKEGLEFLIDVAILRHGFAPYMRDYYVVFESLEGWEYGKGIFRLCFTHCTKVIVDTTVSDSSWKESWSDTFVDYEAWLEAGEPAGYVWGVCWSNAYPGLHYVAPSSHAREWSRRLGKEMHEVAIETDAFHLRLVFHDFTVKKLSDETTILHKLMLPFGNKGDEGVT